MFNLLISSGYDSWDSGIYELEQSRCVTEYTTDVIKNRYRIFDDKTIQELKGYPCIFAVENEERESRIGYITEIRPRQNTIVIHFEFDQILPPLLPGSLEKIRTEIDLGKFELSRTHWAVKDEPIFDILLRNSLILKPQLDASQFHKANSIEQHSAPAHTMNEFNTSQVFIVHGHDEMAKLEMADFIISLGLEPIILHQQASSGLTIIEKIEKFSNVGFGIVLYTPCDVGFVKGSLNGRYRARQNVIFEHGYLIGKLGRSRVSAVVKGDLETPNDISGVVYVPLDSKEFWKEELKNEMRVAGYNV